MPEVLKTLKKYGIHLGMVLAVILLLQMTAQEDPKTSGAGMEWGTFKTVSYTGGTGINMSQDDPGLDMFPKESQGKTAETETDSRSLNFGGQEESMPSEMEVNDAYNEYVGKESLPEKKDDSESQDPPKILEEDSENIVVEASKPSLKVEDEEAASNDNIVKLGGEVVEDETVLVFDQASE